MDAEEIARLVRDLKVSGDTEEKAVVISREEAEKGKKRLERVVVGKIFARRIITREMIRSNLPRILRSRGSTEIEVVGANLFVINFSLDSDKKVALEEGPWHFFQDLMILKQSEAMQTPMDVKFDELSLWIQCHNVPLECMEPHIIERIGAQVGKVEEVDVGERGSCLGKFARVRVSRSIEDPLVRYVPLKQEDSNKDVFVLLQYEKLPDFCFCCGRVGHISRDYNDGTVDTRKPCFGSWLRAGRSYVGMRGAEGGSRSDDKSSAMGNSAHRGPTERQGIPVVGVAKRRELDGPRGRPLELEESTGNIGEHEEGVAGHDDSHGIGVTDSMEVIPPERDEEALSEGAGDKGGGSGDKVVAVVVGGEVSGLGAKKKGKGKSPVKVHLRSSKTGGRSWKKLARERKDSAGGVGTSEGVGGRRGGSSKRKGGLLRDE